MEGIQMPLTTAGFGIVWNYCIPSKFDLGQWEEFAESSEARQNDKYNTRCQDLKLCRTKKAMDSLMKA